MRSAVAIRSDGATEAAARRSRGDRGSAPRAARSTARPAPPAPLEADGLAPLDRAARVGEPERQAGVHVLRRPTPSPIANAASSTSWHTIRPSTSPARPDPLGHEPERPEALLQRRGRGSPGSRGAGVSSTEHAALEAEGGSRPHRARRVPQDWLEAQGSPPARHLVRLLRDRAPRVEHELGRPALAELVARGPGALAQRRPRAGRRRGPRGACHRRRRAPAAPGRPAGTRRPPRTRSSRGPSSGPSRPAATIRAWIGLGRQRGSPKDSSSNDFATSKPTSMPDQVHQLEGPHAEAAAEPADPVDLLVGGHPLLEQPQPLAAERAPAAVHEEAGAVGRDDHLLAHRARRRCSASSTARSHASDPRESPRAAASAEAG